MEFSPNGTSFFGKTYDEAMDLLHDARQYVLTRDHRHASDLDPSDRMILCCEAMRVTARLTHIMAWLLAERAVQNGELKLADLACEPYALSGHNTCLNQQDDVLALGDPWLNRLLGETHGLYQRVMRLDAQVRREVEARAVEVEAPDCHDASLEEDAPLEGFLATSEALDRETSIQPTVPRPRPRLVLCTPPSHEPDAIDLQSPVYGRTHTDT